jgi:hypothetical protein
MTDEAPKPAPKAPAKPKATEVRRKVNRGSTRRINNASETFQKALAAFAAELDRQAWVEDNNGARIGSVALVTYLKQVGEDVNAELLKLTSDPKQAKTPAAVE